MVKMEDIKMKIEISQNFSTIYIYKDFQLVSILDLDENINEVAIELVELFASLGIDCKAEKID